MGRAATAYAVVPRRGKLTRKCGECGANPSARCWKVPRGAGSGEVPNVPTERQNTPHVNR
jgi:hypothetical protein